MSAIPALNEWKKVTQGLTHYGQLNILSFRDRYIPCFNTTKILFVNVGKRKIEWNGLFTVKCVIVSHIATYIKLGSHSDAGNLYTLPPARYSFKPELSEAHEGEVPCSRTQRRNNNFPTLRREKHICIWKPVPTRLELNPHYRQLQSATI